VAVEAVIYAFLHLFAYLVFHRMVWHLFSPFYLRTCGA
jgi:hypothetical protein